MHNMSFGMDMHIMFLEGSGHIAQVSKLNLDSKISPTGPPGIYPGNFTNSSCLGISFFVGVWGSLGAHLHRGPCGQNH